jgi:hypothetical protein
MQRSVLIAVGGNALMSADEPATVATQRIHAAAACRAIASVASDGWRVVITHGNGPQVGAALLRSERAAGEAYPIPLDVCVASTQGEIGMVLRGDAVWRRDGYRRAIRRARDHRSPVERQGREFHGRVLRASLRLLTSRRTPRGRVTPGVDPNRCGRCGRRHCRSRGRDKCESHPGLQQPAPDRLHTVDLLH